MENLTLNLTRFQADILEQLLIVTVAKIQQENKTDWRSAVITDVCKEIGIEIMREKNQH